MSTSSVDVSAMSDDEIRDAVRDHYAASAAVVLDDLDSTASCCSPVDCGPVTRDLYDAEDAGDLPGAALAASLGCGNPAALARLEPGQVVLDLGSGGGIDVLLSARRVGPTGKAYGLDMTPEMLELARRNQAAAGVENVEFLLGTMEDVPLPDASVDVVISNCVINLAADKDRVLREAHRVLRPGGRLAVSDMVLLGPLPESAERALALWTGCVSGALLVAAYTDKLVAAGFADVSIEVTRTFDEHEAAELARVVASAFVRATKP